MQHPNNHFKKSVNSLIYLFIVCCSFGLTACNNGDTNKSETAKTDTTEATSQAQPKASAFLGSGKASYLALHIDTLRRLFLPPGMGGLNCKKMVFRFSTDGTPTSDLVIDGFPTGPNVNNYLHRKPVLLAPVSLLTFDLSNEKTYLSDLELTRTQVTELLKTAGTNTHLIFIPFRRTAADAFIYCISYKLVWGQAESFTDPGPGFVAADELNPSPPADPK
jgi:hypothetical protein